MQESLRSASTEGGSGEKTVPALSDSQSRYPLPKEAQMRKLIAVMTCHQKGAWADAQRRTWVKDIVGRGYADVKFFLGRPNDHSQLMSDEVWLDVDDSYSGIPLKVQEICKYSEEHCYDYVAKCDDDVYIAPERFPALSLMADYIGRFRSPYGSVYPSCFASGFFYWLSSRAAKIVAETPWNHDWMDERFVATALARRGITGYSDFVNYQVSGPYIDGLALLNHDLHRNGTVFCEYGPEAMHRMHLAFSSVKPAPQLLRGALIRQPVVTVTDHILTSPPGDSAPLHKLNRRYNVA